MSGNTTTFRWKLLLGLLALSIILVFVIDIVTLNIGKKLQRDQIGNATWVISQFETNIKDLLIQVNKMNSNASLDVARDVRVAYDILFSRASVIQSLLENPDFDAPIDLVGEWGALHQDVLNIEKYFLFPDLLNAQSIDEALKDLKGLNEASRDFSVSSLHHIVKRSDEIRSVLLESFHVQTIVSFSVILALLIVALAINRIRSTVQHQSKESKQQADELALVLGASLDPIVVFDHNGIISRTNAAVTKVFGYPPDAVQGRIFWETFFVADSSKKVRSLVQSVSETDDGEKSVGRAKFVGVHTDGGTFPMELQLSSITLSDEFRMTVGFLRDITDEITAQNEIEAARDKAIKNDDEKTRFLAVISHELRTPLHGTLASLELLANSAHLSDEQRRYIAFARQCSNVSIEHVNQLLELSYVSFDKSNRSTASNFSPRKLLEFVVESHKDAAKRKSISITVELSGLAIDAAIISNEKLLRHIFSNLVNNAVKYTDRGGVAISLGISPTEGGELSVIFQVKDTGIGIPTVDRERIFGFMKSLNTKSVRDVTGFGLGLYIVKRSVDALSGSIELESKPGVGSCFTFRCIFQKAASHSELNQPPKPHSVAQRNAGPSLNILVAEDNCVNQEVMKGMLEHLGHFVTIVENGEMAVEACYEKTFDVVLMDFNMPVIDGPAASEVIFQAASSGSRPAIIGVTAHGADSVREQFARAGVECTVTKPIGLNELKAVLDRASGHVGMLSISSDVPDQNEEILDKAHILELMDILPRNSFVSFMDRFLAEGDCLVDRMSSLRGIQANDLASEAHSVAGACASIGAAKARLALIEVEEILRAESEIDSEKILAFKLLWKKTKSQINSLVRCSVPASGGSD